ncbi:MAG: hypothetical protein ACOCP8_02770 [archaeon]
MRFIKIKEPHYFSIRLIIWKFVFVIEHKKANFYGKSKGWHIDLCKKKNTIYE